MLENESHTDMSQMRSLSAPASAPFHFTLNNLERVESKNAYGKSVVVWRHHFENAAPVDYPRAPLWAQTIERMNEILDRAVAADMNGSRIRGTYDHLYELAAADIPHGGPAPKLEHSRVEEFLGEGELTHEMRAVLTELFQLKYEDDLRSSLHCSVMAGATCSEVARYALILAELRKHEQ